MFLSNKCEGWNSFRKFWYNSQMLPSLVLRSFEESYSSSLEKYRYFVIAQNLLYSVTRLKNGVSLVPRSNQFIYSCGFCTVLFIVEKAMKTRRSSHVGWTMLQLDIKEH